MKVPSFSSSFPLSLILFFSLQTSITLCSSSSSSSLSFQLIALLSLKSSLKDPFSSFHDWVLPNFQQNGGVSGWCSWSGVKCHPNTSQVVALDLSRRNLSGQIPPQIRQLSSLIYLNLSGNAFDGPLPPAIFELGNLRILDISHNDFKSDFPPGVSKLKFLRIFTAYSNSFTGPLPREFIRLRYLERLNLGGSYFDGEIPEGYGSFPRLKFLYLAGNALNGSIPPQLGFLSELTRMEIGYNEYSGGFPAQLAMLSNLTYLDVSNAFLSGALPPELGNLTMLDTLLLFKNRFSGFIPATLGRLQGLKTFDLSDNQLSGSIPPEIVTLKGLTNISLMNNFLVGEIPEKMGELPNLENLLLWNNSLKGVLPQSLGFSGKLLRVDVSSNSLTGPIPPNLCNGNKLQKLILFSNRFTDPLPKTLANCNSLLRLRIQDNQINGSVPTGFGLLPNLTYVDLSVNNFTGAIPEDLGNAEELSYLNISLNPLHSVLPSNIWRAPNLQIFSASSGHLTGKIPDFIGCKSLYKIELQRNDFNGSIPWDIGHCEKLLSLNLSRNSLTGIIPWEISALPSITDLDLSRNFLSGTIPSNFENCSTLESFNVSFNLLTGPIPSGSIFLNLHPTSFLGNEGLCGGALGKSCDTLSAGAVDVRGHEEPKKTAGAIVWIMAAAFGIGLFVLVAGTRCFHANYSRQMDESQQIGPWKLTAFQRLNFTADDVLECLEMSNKIIGMGSTGTVYRAEMPGGEIIAVKKLWGKQKENSSIVIRRRRGVLAEVEVLGNVRHRNIVRLLGCCCNRDITMLLYEYMPNGNLDDLLHGKNKAQNLGADWVTRYKIALGVAQGICYLHHDCDPVIVHRDLKPSNILLDSEMEARVADFGVAKLIQSDESMSVIAGSYGYIAPEYAYTLQVDEKSDIYSYGVVLMEILSGKRSVDAEFGDGNSIVHWVRSKIKMKDGINDVLDKNAGAGCEPVREEMMQMLRIALLCTSQNPADRPSMRDVVLMLLEAKPKRKLLASVGHGHNGSGCAEYHDIPLPQKPAAEC
ncbi:leucine-rich repeat receptor-like protein kinase TDR [Pyrus communis]|uniref:leucine-rich repeat receptor-like protein kinase TDR n=1 Tax=Pyrus communis TaxID=23211 RepID=UPI0035C1D8C9